jgi:O-antigen ligase
MSAVMSVAPDTPRPDEVEAVVDRPPSAALLVVSAYILLVPLGKTVTIPVSLPLVPSTASSALGMLAIILMLAELITQRDRRRQAHPSALLWLALLGYASLGYAWSVDRPATESGVTTLAGLIGLSVLLAMRSFSAADVRLIERSLIGSAALTGVIALYQWRTDTLLDTGTSVERFALVGDDPNHTASALLLPAAAALVVALDRVERRGARAGAFVAFALAAAAVLLTASRGGLAALVIVVLVVVLSRLGWRRGAAVTGVMLVALLVLPLPVDARPTGSTGRTAIWKVAVMSCEQRCWFGSGLDTFPELHERTVLQRPELGILELRFEPHNVLVGALVELGVLAGLLIGVMAIAAFAAARRSPLRLGRATAAGLAALMLANMFVDGLEFKYFWVPFTVAAIVDQTVTPDHTPEPGQQEVTL